MNLRNNDIEILEIPFPSPLHTPGHRRYHNNISNKSDCYEKAPVTKVISNSMSRITGGSVSKAFLLLEVILRILGRFPFNIGNQSNISKPTVAYLFHCFSWIYFIWTSVTLLILLIITTLGFTNYYLSWTIIKPSEYHTEELQFFNANLVPFVLVWGCLVHSTIASMAFCWNRKYIGKYFETWNHLMTLLQIPLTKSLRKFLIWSNLMILGFFCIMILFFFTNYVPMARGTALLYTMLIRRPFYPGDKNLLDASMTVTGIGFVIILYVTYASRAFVLFFIFKCRLIIFCFDNWNQRLRNEMNFDPKRKNCEETTIDWEKIVCEKLFRDHCRLIKMMKRTDNVFAANLLSYYLTQILTMCFELYYLARTDCFTRHQEDIVAGLLLSFQTFFVFFTVSLEGARVNDSVMEGFQILRSRGIHVMDSREKKYLIQNLLTTFSQNVILTGGKFFWLDRPFIIKVLGAVFTYFVIILQFGSRIDGQCNF